MRLDPSKINSFLFCGHAYYLGQIEKIRGLPGPPRLRGSGVHKGAEVNYRQKIQSHTDLPVVLVQDAARDYIRDHAKDGLAAEEGDGRGLDARVGELVDKTVNLSALYHREIAATTQPILVEEKIELQISADIQLVCILDVQNDRGVCSDIKTAGRAKPQYEADRSLQLTLQHTAATLLARKRGTPISEEVRLDVLVDTKVPKIQQLYSKRNAGDIQAMVEITNTVASAISAGVFLPAAPTSQWRCDPRFCEFFSQCRYVNPNR